MAPNLPLAEAAQPDHRPFGVIAGKELAQVGDQQVLDAVAIDVGQRHVRGVRDARDDRQRAACLGRAADEHQALPHVGAEHVEPLVAVEVHELDVRDRRRAAAYPAWSARSARTETGDSPGAGQGSGLAAALARGSMKNGSACSMSGGSCTVRLHRAHGGTDRRPPVLADEHHPHELVAPATRGEGSQAEETRGTRRTSRAPAARPPAELLRVVTAAAAPGSAATSLRRTRKPRTARREYTRPLAG